MVDRVLRDPAKWPDWAITTSIETADHWEVTRRAIGCHESQIASYEPLMSLPPAHHDAIWGRLSLYRVMSAVNGGRRREVDLFEGLRDP